MDSEAGPRQNATRPLVRTAASVLYLGAARHLPWSPRPGGHVARLLRARLGRLMLDACGSDVNIEHGAWFGSGRGVVLGDRSAIGMDALVIGPVTIGRDVMMGPRCILLASSHQTADATRPMNSQAFAPDKTIVIEDDVFIGAGTVILAGRRIGTGSIVGAGSVVARDVDPFTVVGGNPAREIARRRPATPETGVAEVTGF